MQMSSLHNTGFWITICKRQQRVPMILTEPLRETICPPPTGFGCSPDACDIH